MSEHWPPEWGDPDTEWEDPDGDSAFDLPAEHLAEVSSALASLPMPVLPAAFEARISAAIAAEAAARMEHTGAGDESATVRSSSSDSSRPSSPRSSSRPPGRGRRRRFLSPRAMSTLAACLLVVVGFGYLIAHGGQSSTYSSADTAGPAAAAGSAAAGSAAAAAPSGHAFSSKNAGGSVPRLLPNSTKAGSFKVRDTGTKYQPTTLAAQVKDVVAAIGGNSPTPVASSAGPSGFSLDPSAALAGCVNSLTGGVPPSLVDRASYAGQPAYVIAVPGRAWVVRTGCTAADHELITTIPLAS